VVSPVELDDYEDENDETLVLSSRPDVQRALHDLNSPTVAERAPSRRMAAASPHPQPQAHPHPHPHPHPQPLPHPLPVLLPQPPMPGAETEVLGRPLPEPAMRSTGRRSAERPSLPFASQHLDRTPPPALVDDTRPSNPALSATLLGPAVPAVTAPPPGAGLPRLVANEDLSEVGAAPLVDDPKLGWDTFVAPIAPSDGGHTRLPSEPNDYRIRSNTKWIMLVIVLVLGGAVAVVARFLD
jgi:hypothetical protein